jgi:hypothetical protein
MSSQNYINSHDLCQVWCFLLTSMFCYKSINRLDQLDPSFLPITEAIQGAILYQLEVTVNPAYLEDKPDGHLP